MMVRRFAYLGVLVTMATISLPAAQAQTASGYATKWGQACKMKVL